MSHAFVVNVEGAVEKEGRYLMIVRGADVAHAPGALSFPGGKVDMRYVESRRFDTDDGKQVLSVTFRCRYRSGAPSADPAAVQAVRWMTPEQILRDAPPWFRPEKMRRIEDARRRS